MDASAEDRLPDSKLVAAFIYLLNITSVRLHLLQRIRLPVPCDAPF